eukprot:scaffold3172_cov129-Skeletonema_dohrnii-CCMP3373.AAC.2
MSVEFGLENTTINNNHEQQQHAERSRGKWMIIAPAQRNNQSTTTTSCQPNIDGAALTFKCLQRSVLGRGDHWE